MRMKPRVTKTEFYLAASLRLSGSIASQNNCELMANLKHVNKVFTIPNSRHLHLLSVSVMSVYNHIISLPYTQG